MGTLTGHETKESLLRFSHGALNEVEESLAVPSSLFDLVCLGGRLTIGQTFVLDSGGKTSTTVVGLVVVNWISC